MKDENPKKLLATLVRDIADENISIEVRSLGCVILKNFIINRTKDAKYEDYWINLDMEFKS